jgi:putative alpha-1,2-mannosidase
MPGRSYLQIAALIAAFVGDAPNAQLWGNRSHNYANIWNASRVIGCPRDAAGQWQCPSELEELICYPFEGISILFCA